MYINPLEIFVNYVHVHSVTLTSALWNGTHAQVVMCYNKLMISFLIKFVKYFKIYVDRKTLKYFLTNIVHVYTAYIYDLNGKEM